MASEPTLETHSLFIERDTERKIRHRNKLYYRVNHWPIWIFVFFIAPGPLVFDLFERGFDQRMATWLGVVLVGNWHRRTIGTVAGLRAASLHHSLHRGSAQSALPAYLLHDGVGRSGRVCRAEHRRSGVCHGDRRMAAQADVRVRLLSARRHDVASRCAWAACRASEPRRRARDTNAATSMVPSGQLRARSRFCGFYGRCCRSRDSATASSWSCSSAFSSTVGNMARRGRLPRTRPIVPGEWAVSD